MTLDVTCPFFTDEMVFLRQQFPIRFPLVGVKSVDSAGGEFLEQTPTIVVGASAIDEGRDLLQLAVESIPCPALSLLFPDK